MSVRLAPEVGMKIAPLPRFKDNFTREHGEGVITVNSFEPMHKLENSTKPVEDWVVTLQLNGQVLHCKWKGEVPEPLWHQRNPTPVQLNWRYFYPLSER